MGVDFDCYGVKALQGVLSKLVGMSLVRLTYAFDEGAIAGFQPYVTWIVPVTGRTVPVSVPPGLVESSPTLTVYVPAWLGIVQS